MPKVNQLQKRVLQAQVIADLSKVINREAKHKNVTCVHTPASNGTTNKVLLKRHQYPMFRTECYKLVDGGNMVPCLRNKWVCRHSLAAIIVAAEDKGFTPRFRKTRELALKYGRANKGKVLYSSKTGQPQVFEVNHGKMYFVLEDSIAKAFGSN